MELRCWDPECVGNDLTAGEVEATTLWVPSCMFCGESLERDGRIIGATRLWATEEAEGLPPTQLTAVPAGPDAVLACALTEDGYVVAASVFVGEAAREVERVMVAYG